VTSWRILRGSSWLFEYHNAARLSNGKGGKRESGNLIFNHGWTRINTDGGGGEPEMLKSDF
jgi:hypothetical protein